MAASGYLLILLAPVLSLCGATEYYVRPTEPTNTSCPAQPCLTLNQYSNDSDHYFKSNTVFKFLPGTHHVDRPLTMGNVHNMSWENGGEVDDERPLLVTRFSCETEEHICTYTSDICCAAVLLHDINNVTIKGLAVTSRASGIILQDAVNISVQQLVITCMASVPVNYAYVGILVYQATSVAIHSFSAYNCSYGLSLVSTTNAHITKVDAKHNNWIGIGLMNTTDICITDTTVTQSSRHGMELFFTSNSQITNTTLSHNDENGLYLEGTTDMRITNTTTTRNGRNGMALHYTKTAIITNTTIMHNNMAPVDREYQMKVTKGEILMYSSHAQIYNTSFTGIYTPSAANTITSLPAVILLYNSSVHVSECDFTRNNISAVRAHASNITVSGVVTFSHNRAFSGTAFILIQDSILSFVENSHTYFVNNEATNTGGVFYITNNEHVDHSFHTRSTCFLNTEGKRTKKRITFANNSAGKGGDILYGGQVALGLDGDLWNCLDSFKNISNMSQHGLSLISSDPSRVCLCNETGQPDCLAIVDPTLHTVYPGQNINISAVVVGQDWGTVAGSAYAQFLQRGSSPQLESGQEVQSVTQHKCNNLYYTIFSQSDVSDKVLVLTTHVSFVSTILKKEADDFRYWKRGYQTNFTEPIMNSDIPVYIDISLLPCPPGFMLTTHTPFRCDCDSLLQQMHGIKCHIQEQTIGRSGLLWVGVIQDDNGTNETVAASEYCPLDYCNGEERNVTLSEPDSQCNFNHSGTLCGGCQPGFSLALGSAQCLQCSNKYLALLVPLTLAGPVLVFSIKLLDLTISQGTLNGLIFYANIIKANEYIFLPQGQTNPLTVFIAWLNLDLGVETCLFQGLDAYFKTWLQFVFPFYIWSIAGLIIILARYSDRAAKVMGNNSVPVLATLFLLSHAKLLRTIITALSYTIVYTSHGPKTMWTADGNVDYLGPEHAPLFATAVVILLFLWLPYTLLLFLGQWLHMCNCRLIIRMLMKVKPFLDAHYGPLKSKHRYWFGALLLVRAAILLISALVPSNRSSIIVLCISVSAVMLTYFGNLVNCNLAVSVFDTSFFVNLALLSVANCFTTIAGGGVAGSSYTLIGVAFVQFVGLVLFKVFSILKLSEKVMGCLRRGQRIEDDWELYEEAALLREMESDSEDQDSEGSGSIESLPTY